MTPADTLKWTDVGTFWAIASQSAIVLTALIVAYVQYRASQRDARTRLTLESFKEITADDVRGAINRTLTHLDYQKDWPDLALALTKPQGDPARAQTERDLFTIANAYSKIALLYERGLLSREMFLTEFDQYTLWLCGAVSGVNLIYDQPDYSGFFDIAAACKVHYAARNGPRKNLLDVLIPLDCSGATAAVPRAMPAVPAGPLTAPAAVAGALTVLHPVTRADLPLLIGWFADPGFVRWWGGVPKSAAEVERDYLGLDENGELVLAFIVMRSDVPVGYIQAWSDEPRIGGIDVVLIPAAQRRGYGSDAVAALAKHLEQNLRWTRITIDPLVRNQRAIRAFAAAGFVGESTVVDAGAGAWLIMVFRPANDRRTHQVAHPMVYHASPPHRTVPMTTAVAPANDTVRALRARAVNVSLPKPLLTAGGAVTSAPLVLIDLETAGGVTGRAYLFCYTTLALRATHALLEELATLVVGMPLAPRTIAAQLHARFRLLGPQGLTGMAMAGIDMAAWDALAVAHGVPLCVLLGAEPRALAAYDSLGMMSAQDGVAEGRRSAAAGFTAVKFKIGWPDAETDVQFVEAVRTALGPACAIMMDYNQCLDRGDAIRRGKLLERFGLQWIEEPCRADDDASHAMVARALDTPIQIGENWWGPNDAARSLAADACDEVMLDVMKIGGVTGWFDAVALAAPTGRRVSSHLFPEFSAHLLAATPSARYLEWLDLASPILDGAIAPSGGTLQAADRPGAGLRWNEDAVRRFAV